jgi:hypothetical protein
MKTNIQFGYVDNVPCWNTLKLNGRIWGECCCQCAHHFKVTGHCWHLVSKSNECTCSEPLGFYVCTADNDNYHATLSGEHGACELFSRRK